MNNLRLIESDNFNFEFLSQLAERESWRKEIHRPIYHIHKWWAKRLGSVFRGILLGCTLSENDDLSKRFYSQYNFSDLKVFDPFMGSGTTIGEAHKLGFTAFGRDINPVAAEAVRVAFGPIDYQKIKTVYSELETSIGERIRNLYSSKDSQGQPCQILYYFWVMQANCPDCSNTVDLFPSWIIARNAYPNRKPETQVLCKSCGDIFPSLYGQKVVSCRTCKHQFTPELGTAKGAKATCNKCQCTFSIINAISTTGKQPSFRLYGKLILKNTGDKEYLPVTPDDLYTYRECSKLLEKEILQEKIKLPELELKDGFNTKQAMKYGFRFWRNFFNDRQLLALGWLHAAITDIPEQEIRDAFLTLFSGTLEFNNMFASYKGEGTGAVRHMFSHHILKPERVPIEANVWGTSKSSGSFSNLFRSRLLKVIEYRQKPTEVNGVANAKGVVCSPEFSGRVKLKLPTDNNFSPRGIYLSCGDSCSSDLPNEGIDLIVTDPPFFDNVHYSELADFFYAWQKLQPRGFIKRKTTTRAQTEVQDPDADRFTRKLAAVLRECHRVLKDDGLLVFTYHHSREEGWKSVAEAILQAGFVVINSHPVKSEMSVATPKSQASEPIQLDTIIVCRKVDSANRHSDTLAATPIAVARKKIHRLQHAGFSLSRNDYKVILYGQLLTAIQSVKDIDLISKLMDEELHKLGPEVQAQGYPHYINDKKTLRTSSNVY